MTTSEIHKGLRVFKDWRESQNYDTQWCTKQDKNVGYFSENWLVSTKGGKNGLYSKNITLRYEIKAAVNKLNGKKGIHLRVIMTDSQEGERVLAQGWLADRRPLLNSSMQWNEHLELQES